VTREFHEGMYNPVGKLTKLAVAIGFAVVSLIFFQTRLRRRSKSESSGSPIKIARDIAYESFQVGAFTVALTSEPDNPPSGVALSVTHSSRPERILWQSIPGKSFVSASRGQESVRDVRSHYTIADKVREEYSNQTIEAFEKVGTTLVVSGRLGCTGASDKVGYRLTFSPVTGSRLRFEVEVEGPCNRVYLTYASVADERFYGFGTQYTHFDLKGKRLPIFIGEQGVGRGAQPITLMANLKAGSGGSWHSSYACVPHYITSTLRSLFLENYAYSVFDMREDDSVRIELLSSRMVGQIVSGDSPSELIDSYTEFSGRMRPLPEWILDGAVVGMQGGTGRVLEMRDVLNALETPVAAFWLQDWVGHRTTSFGKQLWWNWELDDESYPQRRWNWELDDEYEYQQENTLKERLEDENAGLMTYINPYLVDVSEKGTYRRNMFEEAASNGYLVKNRQGDPYMIKITDFSAAPLDLTNPNARAWIKGIIKDKLDLLGASGWMADFGEGLPYDAVLFSGESAASYHNRYAEEWARVNREAIREAGREDDVVFFTRSGYSRSPGASTLFWLGDQLVSWDRYDGIKTAVTGLLSSGISGYSLNHSDTGGYTVVSSFIKNYHRSKELLLRWIELSAFTVVFRTHEGNKPEVNHQFYSDEETLRHFSRFAKIYKAWKPYRMKLVEEAARIGLPVVRHPFLHYHCDPEVRDLEYQFMVGSELMVAPVLDPGKKKVQVYLPPGRWIHLWSGETYGSLDMGVRQTFDAPIGEPAVFYREGSVAGIWFREELQRQGL
jgi:sulfoquinovosidase